jgi:hypothetical protein
LGLIVYLEELFLTFSCLVLPLQLPTEELMPYPPYLLTFVGIYMGLLVPFFAILSFAFIVPPLLKRIVQDKKTGVKELMKMMGLPNWMNWFSYFLDAVISVSISVFFIVLICCIEWKSGQGKVIDYSNGLLIFIFLMLYAMALVVSLFALSTLFKSRKFQQILKALFKCQTALNQLDINKQCIFNKGSLFYIHSVMLTIFIFLQPILLWLWV